MRSTSWILMFAFLFVALTIFFAGPEASSAHETPMECYACHHTSPLHDLAVEGQTTGRFVITH